MIGAMALDRTTSAPAPLGSSDFPLSEVAAAALVGYTPAALRLWRRQGRGPAYIKIGRSIRYAPADVREWFDAHRIEPRPR